jgi:hypothetical protein
MEEANMEWQQLLIDTMERVLQGLEKALAHLKPSDLDEQPHTDCNSIGWLTWHLTRTQDRAISELMGEKQIWIKDEWYFRFNRIADAMDTGFGHKQEDIAAFRSPEVGILLDYHRAVLWRSKQYLSSLSTAELGRKLDHPRFPTVEARLAAVISDSLQHLGQVAYLRGLLKGKGWMEV